MSKSETIYNHWAVCDSDGAVYYDDDDRAHIYGRRIHAREAAQEASKDGEKYHVEKVTVR